MDNEEAIRLTPAEKQIVNAIAKDNNINVPLTAQQKEKINKLAQALSAERGKAAQLARDLELARSQMKTKADKSAKNDKKQAEALARAQKALEQKNTQVEELTRQMEELKRRSAEQARLAAISAGAITPDQEKALNRSMEATVRRKLEAEALGQGAAEAFAKNAMPPQNSCTGRCWTSSRPTFRPWSIWEPFCFSATRRRKRSNS